MLYLIMQDKRPKATYDCSRTPTVVSSEMVPIGSRWHTAVQMQEYPRKQWWSNLPATSHWRDLLLWSKPAGKELDEVRFCRLQESPQHSSRIKGKAINIQHTYYSEYLDMMMGKNEREYTNQMELVTAVKLLLKRIPSPRRLLVP